MHDIQRAVDALRAGQLVAFPTETVYGLGADALNPQAAARIFAAKGRPADHPLIVHLPDAEQLNVWARSIPREALALARAFWPGPLTLILKRSDEVPDIVTGGQDTVGLRVPGHPVALALLRAFGSGIAAPSANRFGRISPTTAEHVREELGGQVSMILDGGPCDVGIESTILDLSRDTPVILRPGAITADDIAAVIGRRPQQRCAAASADVDAPRVSGSLAAHYAPRTPLQVLGLEEILTALAVPGRAEATAVLARRPPPGGSRCMVWREAPADAAGFAHALYAALRDLDHLGAARILVEAPEASPSWQAVADRLGRAAVGSGENGGG
ncbi:MAG: threonylcarbamoyl-AMP synthase [Zoogloeaceae bacterium]|nr:threonylcarbamoyl-AMP synthase [Rhodocyclaceae bacterium]MCP5239701.1 threonylcarbamoyl-AMP synthase [Zoogloeaceae bacterium]MCP5256293.1 threonylcarbamoyl-AMP synthase [Zoogloeaceae bacterium]MCW5615694.1 threonylcarbamoyl-AMP synthase [Rhodocyclaceae bacterium]